MGLLLAVFIGVAAGGLARLLMPGREPGALFITATLGVLGSVGASLLGQVVGYAGPGVVASTLGALVVLASYRMGNEEW